MQHARLWRKWIMEKVFWIQFKSESICMCWKHKTKTGQCHCLTIFANVGWKCAALRWASIVANLFLLCNRIFLMSPLHELLLIIRWHLIRTNSALSLLKIDNVLPFGKKGVIKHSTFLVQNVKNRFCSILVVKNFENREIYGILFWTTFIFETSA